MIASAQSLSHDDRLDLVFQALANRTRRELLRKMSAGPARVTDLAAPFGMSLPAISKHLGILERAGLVNRSVKGREHSCALGAAPMATAAEWLSAYRVFWERNLDNLAGFVEGDAARKARE
ncbi:MAG: ArsR/SmtB family transcription factor [Propylenella sp.]